MNGYKKKTKMDEIHDLSIQLRDEQLQNTNLAQKCSDLADEITRKDFTLKAQAYEIQEAYEKINALEDDLHNSETEKDNLQAMYDQRLADVAHYKSEFERKKTECSQLIGEVSQYKRINESLEKSVKIWEISHNEQRQKFIAFLSYVEGYHILRTPGLRAEIKNMINYFSK